MPSNNSAKPRYGIDLWGGGNFIIEGDTVRVNHGSKPALIELAAQMKAKGYQGPLLLRFPHLAKKQVKLLFEHFNRAIKEFKYGGDFKAVFPLKVNQYPGFVTHLCEQVETFDYGLEAGSKAELIVAMTHTPIGSPIMVNGFKDEALIRMGFIAAAMGHDITLTIEGINELELIIKESAKCRSAMPKIGLRIRLHSAGIGIWAKSGGINAKFGLTSTEMLEAVELLDQNGLMDALTMIHFHIGSQMSDISPIKRALREAGNIYAELRKLGADNLSAINLGGGLAVEYAQHSNRIQRNYTLEEFANDVIFLTKEISNAKKVKEPTIFVESGRYVAATHAVLTVPVLELFSNEYSEKSLQHKTVNPPLVNELFDLYANMTPKNAREYLHDAMDHMESLLTLFDLGYIDLKDRANTETLVHLIIKKALRLFKGIPSHEFKTIQDRIQERYLLNFSLFQSLPDYWGLGQSFPVIPLDRLATTPTRSASLWDITCDSDGEVDFNVDNPLYLHEVDTETEEYYLGFFLVGAYQEVLGMRHNLFSHPTEAVVTFDAQGDYTLADIIESQSIGDVLEDIDYDMTKIREKLAALLQNAAQLSADQKLDIMARLDRYLNESGYLKTITA